MAREKIKSGDKNRKEGEFIRETVPVIGCEAGSRRTNGQIWVANKSEYGTALMGKSGTKMIMRL